MGSRARMTTMALYVVLAVCLVGVFDAPRVVDGAQLAEPPTPHILRDAERNTRRAFTHKSDPDWGLGASSFVSTLPQCSMEVITPQYHIHVQGATILFCILTAVTASLAIVIYRHYNFVRVYDQKVHSENISNNLWIIYNSVLCLRVLANWLELGFPDDTELNDSLRSIHLGSLLLHGCATLCLSLALNHQQIYRSGVDSQQATTSWVTGSDMKKQKSAMLQSAVTRTETAFYLLFAGYIVSLYLRVVYPHDELWFWTFFSLFCLQKLPVLVLMLLIVFRHQTLFGPSVRAKVYLLGACLLNIPSDLPLSVYVEVLPKTCILSFLSYIDVVQMCLLLSLCLFFLFVRLEFLRNMEECIWATYLSHMDSDPFDYRLF
eukprot:GFYU01000440.1.p1 GENE.GFYU01000440.1~~GFYU01000440.1.p1  ORF type:complete len:376 (+),score=65.55 GFYU01000440.1:514-1641(+)